MREQRQHRSLAEGGSGASKSLTGARITWELDATNYRYKIEGSTDNTNWITLADRTDTSTSTSTSTSQVQIAMFSASARYVRVTVTGLPSGVWASLMAVRHRTVLYAQPGALPPQALE